MDMATAFSNINWLSVIVAAVSSFLVGGIWYGPLFGQAWMRALGLSEEELGKRNMPMVFGVALLLALFASFNLEMFIGAEADLAFATAAGFFAGIGWVATFLGIRQPYPRLCTSLVCSEATILTNGVSSGAASIVAVLDYERLCAGGLGSHSKTS